MKCFLRLYPIDVHDCCACPDPIERFQRKALVSTGDVAEVHICIRETLACPHYLSAGNIYTSYLVPARMKVPHVPPGTETEIENTPVERNTGNETVMILRSPAFTIHCGIVGEDIR